MGYPGNKNLVMLVIPGYVPGYPRVYTRLEQSIYPTKQGIHSGVPRYHEPGYVSHTPG